MKIKSAFLGAASLAAAGILLASSAQAGEVVVGGNDTIARAYYDSAWDFALLDTNNPISISGDLSSWSVYTTYDRTGEVELVIYEQTSSGFSVVGTSALEATTGGLQTFSLAGGLKVAAGDYVGFYTQGFGVVEFTGSGSNAWATYTGTGSGDLTGFYYSDLPRTYSISVSEVAAVPETSTWAMMLAGFAGLGFLGYRRTKAASIAA